MSNHAKFAAALLSAAAGLAAGAASAQGYGPPPPPQYGYDQQGPSSDYGPASDEEVIVQAPRFREEGGSLDIPPSKVSMSVLVSFADLDLATRRGAHELKLRIADAARGVCGGLREAYPFHKAQGTSCYRDALRNGLVRADEEIATARQNWRNGYDYDGPYGD